MRIDKLTKRWIKNASDERAASRGYRVDGYRIEHVLEFFETVCVLYEGEKAGEPFRLMEWQVDLLSRLFGWVIRSEFFGREVRRFKKASVWKPKKNGKSPTLAGIGTYLTFGDGEQGQKVYTAALDGKQAGIAHEHAIQMVLQSPLLRDVARVNRTTKEIVYPALNAIYGVMAGDNIRGQEGRNASILIDETHVVDARLAKVVEYAGISRAEALHAEFSTAGDNPDGYGKRTQDYGRQVEAGEVDDDRLLFHCHEAPPKATDDELCNDRKLWLVANPSLGTILDEQEFAESLTRARSQGQSEWRTFKMYRFNRWTESVGAWLDMDDWRAARSTIDLERLKALPCWLGLDLAKTRDTTAAVLVFREDDDSNLDDEATQFPRFWMLSYFWLPKDEAERVSHQVPYREWGEAGAIKLIDGKAVDYDVILRDLLAVCETYDVQQVLYDEHYAEDLTQRLHDAGTPRIAFPQTITHFAGPTAAFERMLLDGQLKHTGNPVLDWHARNVSVKRDPLNGNMRPVKPSHENHRKIDGIVAAIMALSGATADDQRGRFYETHDVELG